LVWNSSISAASSAAHLGGHLRFRRQCPDRHVPITWSSALAGRGWPSRPRPFRVLGYQLFIVLAATGYLLGITQGKEYAEPEWYVDLWLTIVWVAYLVVFVGTILKRAEPHIYVANWFYLSFILTVAMLHLVNNASIPISFFGSKSISVLPGCRRAGAVVVRP
jgi:cytochrome c oxidase cbb3-type subunit 1